MRSELNYDLPSMNEEEFGKLMDDLHDEKCGWNFEVVARLWHTPEGADKSIMVEYQAATRECREVVENEDEPDWLTAYGVEDENEYDCSSELYTEIVDGDVTLAGLEDMMLDFAKRVGQMMIDREQCQDPRAALSDQIKAAEKQDCSAITEIGKEQDIGPIR